VIEGQVSRSEGGWSGLGFVSVGRKTLRRVGRVERRIGDISGAESIDPRSEQ
jgi:hypothetical protein